MGGTNDAGGDAASGTGGNSIANPPGYFTTKDWNVASVDWHGCAWTSLDSTVVGSTTSITPLDFTRGSAEGGPYRVSGTVYGDYNAFAMIRFHLNEAVTDSDTQCAYDLAKLQNTGPPAAVVPSSAQGIAVSWIQGTASPLCVQIQSSDGRYESHHRWCANITDAGGPTFLKFTDFYTHCWENPDGSPGVQYARESIDAVVFIVPGDIQTTIPFDFTIMGFAPGNSKADAPILPGGVGGSGGAGGIGGTGGAPETPVREELPMSGLRLRLATESPWVPSTGAGWVSLGSLDTITDPRCGSEAITSCALHIRANLESALLCACQVLFPPWIP